MKIFDQCKDEVAEKYGCLDWSDLINSPIEDDEEIISKLLNEAAELHAQEVAKDTWERACEAQRDIFEDVYGPEINHIGKPLYQPSKFDQPNQEKP